MFRKIFLAIFLMTACACAGFAEQSKQITPAVQSQKQGIEIYLFVSAHCKACLHFKNEIKPKIEQLYQGKIYFREFDIDVPENYKKLAALADLNSVKPAYPAVFLGKRLLIGNKQIEAELPTIIEIMLKKNLKTENINLDAVESIDSIFKKFSVVAIISAGLIDGINPCAFTVIVFFISFLAVYGYRRREMAVIGATYILAVFCAYLAIGLGLFNFLYALDSFYTVTKIFYSVIALLCFVLGILCLLDFFTFRRTGSTQESFLQLPDVLKKRIQNVIGDEFRAQEKRGVFKLACGAFSVGVIVSVLEAVCTGQVYLPVISFVLRSPGLKAKAAAYLLLYNLMFILPLIAVFALSLWGVNSQQFGDYYKKRYGFIRLCMFLLFIALGLSMLAG